MYLNFTKHGFDLKYKNLSSIFMIFCTFRRISIDLCNKSFREIHQKDFKRCKQISLFRWWSMSPRQRPVVNSDSVWHYGSLLFLVVLLKHFYCPVLRDIVLLRITVLTSIILYDGAPSSPLFAVVFFALSPPSCQNDNRWPIDHFRYDDLRCKMKRPLHFTTFVPPTLPDDRFEPTWLPFSGEFPSSLFEFPAKKFIFFANTHTFTHQRYQ